MSIGIEAGELMEVFQWRDLHAGNLTPQDRRAARALLEDLRFETFVQAQGGHTRPGGAWELDGRPEYLRTAQDAEVVNYRDWGIQLGRRFRALKLWFLIREQGVAGLQARLRRDCDNAQWLAKQVEATPGWRVLAPVTLQTVCLRHDKKKFIMPVISFKNVPLIIYCRKLRARIFCLDVILV